MPRFDRRTTSKLRDLTAALGTWSGESALRQTICSLQEMLELDAAAAYGVDAREDMLALSFLDTVHLDSAKSARLFGRLVAAIPRWGLFDPACPEPAQRNRAFLRDETPGIGARTPVTEVFARVGVARMDSIRVLICEGPSLLAWLGGWRDGALTVHNRRILQAMVPPVRARLRLERRLADASLAHAALGTALEALGTPAFVTSATGRAWHANAAGMALLARDRTARGVLVDAALGRDPSYQRLAIPGSRHLLLVHRGVQPAAIRVADIAERHRLTMRQREVLALIARGASNAAIAAELRCAERTVEAHVTALLSKLEVSSRAALVARVLA